MTCANCKMRKTYVFNLLKKDKAHPRFYIVHCGLSPAKDYNAKDCTYFKKK